jgi:hypothetical protein
MSDWWNTLSGAHQVFWVIALVFSVLFLIQFVLSLIGLDFDSDADADAKTDHGMDANFTIFSVRSIIAFFTFFGWGGVLALNAGGNTIAAVAVAGISGFAAMVVVGYMMFWFSKLNQEGNIDLNNAIYQTGKVYLPIPANGRGQGKVHISIGGSLKEIDAITEGKNLPTGSTVRVIEVINDNVFVVEKVEGLLPHEQFHPRK